MTTKEVLEKIKEEISKLADEAEEKCYQWMKCGDEALQSYETGKLAAYVICMDMLSKYIGE